MEIALRTGIIHGTVSMDEGTYLTRRRCRRGRRRTPRQSPKSQVTRIPHAALVKGSHIYRGLFGKNGEEILVALSFELDPYKDER
jgi:hypothetical protein